MRRRSVMVSSLSGSPKRMLSQMSIHDFLNFQLLEHNYDQDNMGEMLTESLNIARQSCIMIVKKAAQIIEENYIVSQLSQYGCQWAIKFSHVIIKDIEEDDNQIIYNNDEIEPIPCPIEHWRRMIGQIQSPKVIQIENRTYRRESQLKQLEQSVIDYGRLDTQPVKMGEIDDDLDFDTEIESMRQAKARQILNQQQRLIQDQIKKQEYNEMNRQLKRLNVDSKSKYTYDFEGRVLVQKPPDVERFPNTQQDIQEKRVLLEVKDLFPNHKKQLESISNYKRKTLEPNINNVQTLSNRFNSQIDIIQLKQGVTFIEGKNEKKNERQHSLIDFKDPKDIQKTLSQINIKMSKEEYSVITNTQLQSSFIHKQQQSHSHQKSIQQFQQQIQQIQQVAPQSINGDQSIYSLNSSVLQKLNGTISIMSEHLDELIINDPIPNYTTPTQMKLPQIQQPQIPIHMLTEPPQQPLTNSVTKLPKALFVPGTFSKIIPKYPRDRISRIVKQIKQ